MMDKMDQAKVVEMIEEQNKGKRFLKLGRWYFVLITEIYWREIGLAFFVNVAWQYYRQLLEIQLHLIVLNVALEVYYLGKPE